MNSLYQKYHGKPGIGVQGLLGNTGNAGKGIFIGFINDFFDSNDISINTIVKIGKRIINNQELDTTYKAYANSRFTKYLQQIKNYTDSSFFPILSNKFNNEGLSLYYTGRISDEETSFTDRAYDDMKYDIMDNPVESNAYFKNRNLVNVSIGVDDERTTDRYIFNQIYNIVQNEKTYVQLYDYNKDDEGNFTNEPKYDVLISVNTITFEPLDVVKLFGGYYDYNAPIYGSNINTDDELLYLNYLAYFNYINSSTAGTPWWTSETSVENSDNNSFFERRSFITTAYTPENYPGDASLYAMGVDSHFTIASNITTYDYNVDHDSLPANIEESVPNLIYMNYNYTGLDLINIDFDFLELPEYVHVTANTIPPSTLSDPFIDDNGMTLVAIDMYDPSIREALVLKTDRTAPIGQKYQYEFDDVSLYNILDAKGQKDLKNFSSNYRHVADEFLQKYEVTISHYKNNGTIYADSSVRWSSNDYEKVSIPTTLSEKYQPGDVLYFYIDKEKYNEDNQIQYMITISEDLLKCDINTLIKNAKIVNPFKYQTLFTTNNRILLYDNANIIKNNISVIDRSDNELAEEKFYMHSVGNIISDSIDSALLLAAKENNIEDKLYNQLELISYNKDYHKLSINSSIIDDIMNYYISSDSVLKFENMYIKDNIYLTNLESEKIIIDENIIYSDNNCILHLDANDLIVKMNLGNLFNRDTYDSFNTYLFTFNKSKFIKNPKAYSDYQVGYIVYAGSSVLYEKLYDNLTNQFNIEIDPISDTNILSKEPPTSTSIIYNILVYIRKYNGYNIYSHCTKLKCDIEYNELYHITLPEYTITTDNDLISIEYSNNTNNIDFSISGITVEYGDNIIFDINGNNEDICIDSVFFNNTELIVNSAYWEWADKNDTTRFNASTQLTETISWVREEPIIDTIIHENSHKSFKLTVDDNIPNIIYEENNQLAETVNIKDFMVTFSNESTSNTDDFGYYDLFFNNDGIEKNEQCALFDRIMENLTIPMAAPRTINVAVKYHIANDEASNYNGQYLYYYENYTIKQPGFTDPRSIPYITLNMHTDINDLNSYNTINNGILCNQFQTFMDIKILDFDWDTWGKYITADDDATLELEITNIHNDLLWQKELSIAVLQTRATIKMLPDDLEILTDNNVSTVQYNNCVKLIVNVFKNTTDKSISQLNQNDINELTAQFANKCTLTINHKLMSSISGRDITEDIGENDEIEILDGYILLSNSICRGLKNPAVIYSGIFENIKIYLHDLTVKDVQDLIYVQFKIEFGNPVLSNLYLQFAVTKLNIHYKYKKLVVNDSTGEPILDINGNKQYNDASVNFSTYADNSNINDTYLHQIEDYKETYTYISNKLDIMFNPISLIACPPEAEESLTYLSGSVKKTGSEDQIKLVMKFFANSLYTDESITNINKAILRNMYKVDLNGILIKFKHLQDNIQYISYNTLELKDTINKVDNDYIFNYDTYESILTLSKQYEPINNKNYLSIIYHSNLLNPKLREDKRTFYYNEKLYLESKYDQFNMNCPAFISQEHDWQIRTDDIMTSIDIWNFEYQSQADLEEDAKVFPGILNNYGNGYMYLKDEIDTGLYNKNGVLSLLETKEFNSETLYDKSEYFDIGTATPINIYTPSENKYFRVPLYHMTWEYPVYNGTNIIPYYIVSMFDYLLIRNYINAVKDENIELRDKIVSLITKYNLDSIYRLPNFIPYNILFNISPKILFNDDCGNLNMLMLRRPSIEDDTDLSENSISGCYKLNTRYYNTTTIIESYMPLSYNIPS